MPDQPYETRQFAQRQPPPQYPRPHPAYPPAGAASRTARKGNQVLWIVAAAVGTLALLCCGGGLIGAAVSDDRDGKKPTSVVASNSPAPTLSPSESLPSAEIVAPPSATEVAPPSAPAVTSTAPAPVRTSRPAPTPKARTTRPPNPPPPPRTTTPPAVRDGVTPGAFCSPEGALGRTSTGKLMRCTRLAGEERARWRAA